MFFSYIPVFVKEFFYIFHGPSPSRAPFVNEPEKRAGETEWVMNSGDSIHARECKQGPAHTVELGCLPHPILNIPSCRLSLFDFIRHGVATLQTIGSGGFRCTFGYRDTFSL
jgi:hypothetical protein